MEMITLAIAIAVVAVYSTCVGWLIRDMDKELRELRDAQRREERGG